MAGMNRLQKRAAVARPPPFRSLQAVSSPHLQPPFLGRGSLLRPGEALEAARRRSRRSLQTACKPASKMRSESCRLWARTSSTLRHCAMASGSGKWSKRGPALRRLQQLQRMRTLRASQRALPGFVRTPPCHSRSSVHCVAMAPTQQLRASSALAAATQLPRVGELVQVMRRRQREAASVGV
jgi:hypothetical protein